MAAVVVAEVAVVLLRPRHGVIEPAPVRTESYFSPQQIERAEDFRGGQLALYGGTLLIEIGLLIALVRRPPQQLRGRFVRPVLAAAATGAGLAVALELVPLPLRAYARERAIDVGLVTQSWPAWAWDVTKGLAIGGALAGIGAAIAIGLMRRFGRQWWLPGSAAVVAIAAVFIYAGPVVLDPLFSKFERVPEGQVRSDVQRLAKEAGVKVGEVYVNDASRRTTAINAYVTGLGSTKRVVLYDNLVEDFSREERNLVVAHELGHVHFDDVPRGLLFVALVAPFAMAAIAVMTRGLAPPEAEEPGPLVVPALALSLAIVSFGVTIASNQLSRRVEERADSYALKLTNQAKPFIGFQRRIAVRNVSDPDPPGWLHALLGTHPTTLDRIGMGVAYERARRPEEGSAEAARRRTPGGS